MPGPVSDSYDPEWSTTAVADEIENQLKIVYARVSEVLLCKPPLDIRELINRDDLKKPIAAAMSEKDWRLIRFALERARESL